MIDVEVCRFDIGDLRGFVPCASPAQLLHRHVFVSKVAGVGHYFGRPVGGVGGVSV
jgi:hypothetical protein